MKLLYAHLELKYVVDPFLNATTIEYQKSVSLLETKSKRGALA
jgi:hypothetical protein